MASTNRLIQARSVKITAGFSIIELMAVVTILSILSIAAVASYRKYSQRGKNMEAIHMLSDIGMKQAMHFSLYGFYVDTTANPGNGFLYSDMYPATADIPGGQVDWNISCPDDADAYPGWCALGVRPSGKVNYQYVTEGWAPGDPTGIISTPGASAKPIILDTSRQWWYAVARGDLDQDGTFKTFIFTSEVNEVFTIGLTE
jgi:prepilin-type N-terminal cleavage/methylation domain-containing protein